MRTKPTFARIVIGVTLTLAVVVVTGSQARAKLTAEQSCQKSRYDVATKYAQCEGKAIAQLFATNDLAKLQPALSKCRVKYTATYVKLQKKAVGTGSTCESPRFVDNGDGTVTDNLTALQWEKKTDDATLHDKDLTDLWVDVYPNILSGAGANQGFNEYPGCFALSVAEPCNWRLPTVAELQTILSEPFPCTTSPCIDPIFGPTVAGDYWSSTTLADNATYAWGVFFGTGEVSYAVKDVTRDAFRAVRGGL